MIKNRHGKFLPDHYFDRNRIYVESVYNFMIIKG